MNTTESSQDDQSSAHAAAVVVQPMALQDLSSSRVDSLQSIGSKLFKQKSATPLAGTADDSQNNSCDLSQSIQKPISVPRDNENSRPQVKSKPPGMQFNPMKEVSKSELWMEIFQLRNQIKARDMTIEHLRQENQRLAQLLNQQHQQHHQEEESKSARVHSVVSQDEAVLFYDQDDVQLISDRVYKPQKNQAQPPHQMHIPRRQIPSSQLMHLDSNENENQQQLLINSVNRMNVNMSRFQQRSATVQQDEEFNEDNISLDMQEHSQIDRQIQHRALDLPPVLSRRSAARQEASIPQQSQVQQRSSRMSSGQQPAVVPEAQVVPNQPFFMRNQQVAQLQRIGPQARIESQQIQRVDSYIDEYAMIYNDNDGPDEFEVAEERAHLFGENVNADIMTYEQLVQLQERIGFVNKGMTVKEMDRFPQIKMKDLKKYLRHKKRPAQFQSDPAKKQAQINQQRFNALQRVLIQVPMPAFVRPDLSSSIDQNVHLSSVNSVAQDELLPEEESKSPVHIHSSRVESSDFSLDEAEELHNRRLPMLDNVNVPASSNFGAKQNELAQRHQQHPRLLVRQLNVNEVVEDEDGGYSANLHDEHLQEQLGIQAPKFNKTKHNQIDNMGPRKHIFHKADMSYMSCSSCYSQQQQDSSRELCIICYDQISPTDYIKLIEPCNHYFHTNCINQWLLVEKKCPMCMCDL